MKALPGSPLTGKVSEPLGCTSSNQKNKPGGWVFTFSPRPPQKKVTKRKKRLLTPGVSSLLGDLIYIICISACYLVIIPYVITKKIFKRWLA
jgi:hypothetical protein